MTLFATTFPIHRRLGWLIGLQVLWVAGGVEFSLVPFTCCVKCGDPGKPPTVVLPAGWAERVTPALQGAARLGDLVAVAAVATPKEPALRVSYPSSHEPIIVPADGSAWTPPDEPALRRFASSLYRGQAAVTVVEHMTAVPRRLGIVNVGAPLRAASVTAFGLVLASATLAALAVRRRWRVAHKLKRD